MFNRSAFGRITFDRPFSVLLTLTTTLHADGVLTTLASLSATTAAKLDGETDLSALYIRDITGTTVTLEAIAELALAFAREFGYSAHIDGVAELDVILRHTRVSSVTISSPVAPGERITLDADRNLTTKSGIPIGQIGDIPYLHPGENTITYQDAATDRNIKVRITYRDRYL